MKLNDNQVKKIILLAGPSGSGKGTVKEILLKKYPQLTTVTTHTTRPPRSFEKNGVQRHFVNEKQFQELIEKNAFLEYAHVHEWMYGTSIAELQKEIESGKVVILEVDEQGVFNIKKMYPEIISIFLDVPDLNTLRRRIKERGAETEEQIATRLETAKKELSHKSEHNYVIMNEDGKLDETVEAIETIIEKRIL